MSLIPGNAELKITQGSTWEQPISFPSEVDLSTVGIDVEITITKCTDEEIILNTGNEKIVIDDVDNKIDCYLTYTETKRFTRNGAWKLEIIYHATESSPDERFTYLTGQVIVKRDITEI